MGCLPQLRTLILSTNLISSVDMHLTNLSKLESLHLQVGPGQGLQSQHSLCTHAVDVLSIHKCGCTCSETLRTTGSLSESKGLVGCAAWVKECSAVGTAALKRVSDEEICADPSILPACNILFLVACVGVWVCGLDIYLVKWPGLLRHV